MIRFDSDYAEGAHPLVLQKLTETNLEQTPGYGVDAHCQRAAELIRERCKNPDCQVHFLTGGTQTNRIVIAAMLRPHQCVLCPETGHINTHESGAVEAGGHKVVPLRTDVDGKLTAEQVRDAYRRHMEDDIREHLTQPKLVYISQPTELGTLYSRRELTELSAACRECGLQLYIDGARLGYGLAARGNDVDMAFLAHHCDAFYIGGTKVGALFGEAVVLMEATLKEDFRYLMKQHGGLLAKGRLLGVQFEALFEDDLYTRISRHADEMADRLRAAVERAGYAFLVPTVTNQIFPILPEEKLRALREKYAFIFWQRVDGGHSAIRLCTSWATRPGDVDALVADLRTP